MSSHAKRAAYVDLRMKALGKGRALKAQVVGREGGPDPISGSLLIALAIRESGLRNVLGDYDKAKRRAHARGAFQIHDKFHAPFLHSVVGCVAAPWIPEASRLNWIPVPGTNALMRGMCPTWEDGARYAVKVLRGHIAQAEKSGISTPEECLRIAVAAYNCGFGRAFEGAMAFDVDKHTTGGDYSADVLRRRSEVAEWLREHPRWRL